MTIFSDLGGNGKGVELTGVRLAIFGRNNAKKRFPSVTSVPPPPPPPPPSPPLGTYYYAPIIAAGGI
jgi:hypothetical protein